MIRVEQPGTAQGRRRDGAYGVLRDVPPETGDA